MTKSNAVLKLALMTTMLSACTSAKQHLTDPGFKTPELAGNADCSVGSTPSDLERISSVICTLRKTRSGLHDLRDSEDFSDELYDIPTLAFAITSAGLFILGAANANLIPSWGIAAEDLAFAAASTQIVKQYSNPAAQRLALTSAIKGYGCLIQNGEETYLKIQEMEKAGSYINAHSRLTATLKSWTAYIESFSPSGTPKNPDPKSLLPRAKATLQAAQQANAFFRKQENQAGKTASFLKEATFDMIENARDVAVRGSINYQTIGQTIQNSINTQLSFDSEPSAITNNAPATQPEKLIQLDTNNSGGRASDKFINDNTERLVRGNTQSYDFISFNLLITELDTLNSSVAAATPNLTTQTSLFKQCANLVGNAAKPTGS